MTDTKKLDLLLSGMQQINQRIEGLEGQMNLRMDSLEQRMDGLDQRIDGLEQRMDGLELQIESTQRALKNEIRKSEALILDEVERVHIILEKHKEDSVKHIA